MNEIAVNSKVSTTLSNVKGTESMTISGDAKLAADKKATASDNDLADAVEGAEDLVNELFDSEGSEDAALTDSAEADMGTDEFMTDEAAMKEGYVDTGVIIDPGYMDGGMFPDGGMMVDPTSGMKSSLLSSWPFVIGISSAVLAVSIVLGALLARRKIKKGIELYED